MFRKKWIFLALVVIVTGALIGWRINEQKKAAERRAFLEMGDDIQKAKDEIDDLLEQINDTLKNKETPGNR